MTEPEDDATMTPEEAMRKMAHVTANTRALRIRTEGLTLVVWAIIMAAAYLTIVGPIGFGGGGGEFRPPPNGAFNATFGNRTFDPSRFGGPGGPGRSIFLSRFAPVVWYGIGAVVTAGIWRSASLSFQTGVSTRRILLVFGGWIAVFLAATVYLTYFEASAPRSWHLVAWGSVFGLFAVTNPLRFSGQGRMVAGVMAASALAFFLYAHFAGLGPRDTGYLTALALSVPGLAGGLWLLFRG